MSKQSDFLLALEASPIIGAVKDEKGLCEVLKSECAVVFVLYGCVADIVEIVSRIKLNGKYAMVHADLVDGLAAREAAIDFIKQYSKADGIISTKPMLIKRARALGLLTVQRFFLLDSLSLDNVSKQMENDSADAVEILPGVMPKIIKRLCEKAKKPLIAGGLISDKEDIVAALSAGAFAVSTTNTSTWNAL